MDGATAKDFDFGSEQMRWFEEQLVGGQSTQLRPLVFTHLYPSELLTKASAFSDLIQKFKVELVEMGPTHYNELANDGRTIYATTRSAGRIEEGPSGFSLTTIDGDVVSWKFKERGPWPFVMITSPADQSSSHDPKVSVTLFEALFRRAKVWGNLPSKVVTCSIDNAPEQPMQLVGNSWQLQGDSSGVPDGQHHISVHAEASASQVAFDEIAVLSQSEW